MTTLIDTLSTVFLCKDVTIQTLLSHNAATMVDNNTSIDELSDRYKQDYSKQDNACSGGLTALWLGEKKSTLRSSLIEYLLSEDINLILFSKEEHLWSWLTSHPLEKDVSLIIETKINIENVISRSDTYPNIRSILVRCSMNELISLERISRSYIKIDGLFANDTRLLIKLIIDMALYSEELADQLRENQQNELDVQRNYDRALKLCALARRI